MDKFHLIQDEGEGNSSGFSLDQEPSEGKGVEFGLVQGEEDHQMIHIGNGGVQDLGRPGKHLLYHSSTIRPINGPHQHLITHAHPPFNLLQQSPNNAQQFNSRTHQIIIPIIILIIIIIIIILIAAGDNDSHEIGLGGGD